jgi:hypothetical protein
MTLVDVVARAAKRLVPVQFQALVTDAQARACIRELGTLGYRIVSSEQVAAWERQEQELATANAEVRRLTESVRQTLRELPERFPRAPMGA